MTVSRLPIDDVIPELLLSMRSHPNCILHAPPGAGKTTRVPLALLDVVPDTNGRIIMLEPRRLAAVSAARWMARLLGEDVGRTVGYSIRFDSKVSGVTRIEVVTEAILTRRIQSDPLMEGIALVIFDEFHERSIHSDLGLALCLDVQRQVRPDLKVLIMSATLECAPLSGLMDGAPIISSQGRSFPVEEIYLEDQPAGSLPLRMASAVLKVLSETRGGDLLVFLPGAGEIRACAAILADSGTAGRGVSVHPLYGDLPFDQQQAAILPGSQRKVVLATSIAETSLTIEGVRTVLDCGLSRRVRHDPASGMNRLVTVRESRSSAEQRKGRAGRVAPGTCYRLFSRHTHSAMTAQTPPEILDSDLSPLVLDLAAWGVRDSRELPWLEPPPTAAMSSATQLLQLLTALDRSGLITPLGSAMARLPLHPRLARLLLRSRDLGLSALGCDLATLLSEREIIRQSPRGSFTAGRMVDLNERLDALNTWRSGGNIADYLDVAALKNCERISLQLKRIIGTEVGNKSVTNHLDSLGRLLLSAYPDRVARLREGDEGRYLLANGRGARLSSAGSVSSALYIVAVSVDGGTQSEGVIHQAHPVTEALLREELAHRIESRENVRWDSTEGRIVAARDDCLGAIRLASRPFVPSEESVLPVVIEAVRMSRLALLNRTDPFYQLQSRILLLRRTFPNDAWPDVSDDALLETLECWLEPYLSGIRNSQQLATLRCAEALSGLLDYRHRTSLDELAPSHLEVPSGSKIRLDYCASDQPVLAVKLQELFGLADTPTVTAGRVPVLLHLLSPAGRPLQVTQDLKGFWDGSYHQVKKEMKGRYPKHPWPDDPWNAVPTRKTKPRGT